MSIVERTSIPPQIAGEDIRTEWMIATLKAFVAAVGVVVGLSYYALQTEHYRLSLLITLGLLVGWLAGNVLIRLLLRRNRSVSRVAAISTLSDLAVVTGIDLVLCVDIPLNFMNGPIATMYFLVIAVSAIRKDQRLVVQTGIACALVYILTSIYFFYTRNLSFDVYLSMGNGMTFRWLFFNQIIIASVMALFSIVVGYVTLELNKSERHYLALFENIPDGIVIVSPEGAIIAANGRFAAMVGMSVEQLIGCRIDGFLSARHGGAIDPQMYARFTRLNSRSGDTRPIEVTSVPIDIDGRQCRELSVRDVSSRVELEQQLARAQKVQTIGRLAGGLAHDFNNLLGGIFGAVSLSRRTLQKLGTLEEQQVYGGHLSTIMDCGETAARILSRLSSFSRSTIVETSVEDIRDILRETATIVRSNLPQDITIRVENEDEPLFARADRLSVSQAVLSLSINAVDAIGGAGGDIVLRARTAEPGEIEQLPELRRQSPYICIEVTDNGPGMDEETQRHIFEPFFTTKSPGKGTGIGLAMVFNVAIGHGGTVNVSSSPGNGAIFRLYLESERESVVPMSSRD